jgi:hypothetical protein
MVGNGKFPEGFNGKIILSGENLPDGGVFLAIH